MTAEPTQMNGPAAGASSRRMIVAMIVVAALVATLAIVALPWMRPTSSVVPITLEPAGGPLPVFYTVPEFSLTSQQDQPTTLDDLKGKVWIADFVFTRCQGPCPIVTSKMATLQSELQDHPSWDQLRLVSFSVDPSYDTPTVLKAYGQQYNAGDHWLFLTGQRQNMWQLIEAGFKLPVADDPGNERMPISHSTKFVLVDQQGNIRGYYNALDDQERQQLITDAHKLLAGGKTTQEG